MNLKEYLSKYESREGLAYKCDLTVSCLNHYLSGRRKPYQSTAERIEKETGGRVTVLELRGKDDRRR